jgi:hypothetical protein
LQCHRLLTPCTDQQVVRWLHASVFSDTGTKYCTCKIRAMLPSHQCFAFCKCSHLANLVLVVCYNSMLSGIVRAYKQIRPSVDVRTLALPPTPPLSLAYLVLLCRPTSTKLSQNTSPKLSPSIRLRCRYCDSRKYLDGSLPPISPGAVSLRLDGKDGLGRGCGPIECPGVGLAIRVLTRGSV